MKKGGEKMKGLKLAVQFLLGTADLGICFPLEKTTILKDFLKNPTKFSQKTQELVEHTPACFPYFKAIAQLTGIQDPLAFEIVEAYFIGNHLLRNLERKSEQVREVLIRHFSKIQEKFLSLPNDFLPHHNFHVYLLGSVTGKIEPVPEVLNLCRISWARVVAYQKKEIVVEYRPIVWKKGRYVIDKKTTVSIPSTSQIISEIQEGDWVALHWNNLCAKLNPPQVKELYYFTQKAINLANRGED
ncbi:MAG: DUF6390 family protein [Candidatus Pacebacteria bacterium]|nr:DUF6390 family protein [Candidatus Paceibacterota bacterium]